MPSRPLPSKAGMSTPAERAVPEPASDSRAGAWPAPAAWRSSPRQSAWPWPPVPRSRSASAFAARLGRQGAPWRPAGPSLCGFPRLLGRPRLLRRRQLVRRRIGDRGRLDLGAPDLPRELADVARRLHGDEHLGALALARQRDIARAARQCLRVHQIGVVEGLALPLVDRPGVAVPEAANSDADHSHLRPSRPAAASSAP